MPVDNWNWIRAFVAVAETGSLSGAAEQLQQSQPTLSRQIQQLESATGHLLFRRTTRGLTLTEQGEQLLRSARDMEEAANRFNRQLSGQSTHLSGDIRLSTSELIGFYLMPPAIRQFQQQWPDVRIDLVLTNQVSSLSKGEADMALRTFRPKQPDLVVKRVAEIELGFFAHRDYLTQFGIPESLEDLYSHRLIGPDQDESWLQIARSRGLQISRQDFSLRTDSLLLQLAMLRSAAGIAPTHVPLARQWPDLIQVLPDLAIEPIPLWLVCHGDVQHNARVRVLQQFLIDWFRDPPYSRIRH